MQQKLKKQTEKKMPQTKESKVNPIILKRILFVNKTNPTIIERSNIPQ